MEAPAADGAREATRPRVRSPIIGRHVQLGELTEALDDARAGRGSLFVVAGEAGIGKTRLAEAVAEQAAGHGDTVLWGSAWEAGGAPAYWPWRQAIRELVRRRPAGEVEEDLGAGAPHVAQVAPELVRAGVEPVASLDTESARFTAFDATASFLAAASARRPIVLLLDDLHAADVPTVRLLEFLARSLKTTSILAIGTYRAEGVRQGSEVATALADLGKDGRRLVLGGLSRDEVRDLASTRAPLPPSPSLVDRLHALTEGNPLFVDEVMRLLNAEGALSARGALASGRLPVPDAVRETIRRRLAPVAPPVVRALTAGAVLGQEFRIETLARVVPEERPQLLGRLDTAVQAGLIEEAPGGVGRYRFAHALIRETLYDDLSVHDRVAMHGAVAEALLLDAHGEPPDSQLSVLAHHLLQAAPDGDPALAAEYAAKAGARALASMAYEHAIDLLYDALRALEMHRPDPGLRGPILLTLGEAEMSAGRLVAGRATLRGAADDARRLGDADLLARAALAAAPWGLATATADEEGLIPLLEEALAGLGTADGALRARLLARLAAAQYWTSPPERRAAQTDEAIAIARRLGEPATLACVLSDAHRATWDPDSPSRALPWADEIYRLAGQVGNVELAMVAHSWRISLLLELGRIAVVDYEIGEFASAAKRLHQQRAQAQALLHACTRAVIDGRFGAAEGLLGEAAAYTELLEQDPLMSMRLGALAFVMREVQWRLPELEGAVQHFADANPAMPVWRCGLLCVHLQAGNDEALRGGYERLIAGGFAAIPRDNLWLPAMALLSEACAHLGDRAGAAQLEALLEPYGGRNVVTPDVAFIGPVDRYLALLAAARDDVESALERFASARASMRALGARPTIARLALDEARVLRERDPPRSAALAAEAVAEAKSLGLDALVEAALPLAGGAIAPGPRARAATARLHRRGDMWEVSGGGAPFHLKDAKGLQQLARLLAQPGHEFHALELAAPATAPNRRHAEPELDVRARGQDDAGPLLDARAKAEYRERIAALRAEIEEADSFNDPERASRAREELEFVAHELSAATGLGGRDRRAAGNAERARVNVTRALRSAVERIAEHDAALGHHLGTCVHTGIFCSYDPGPEGRVWDLGP